MMKKTLSLLMFVSLGSSHAMAKSDESVLCIHGLEAAVAGLSLLGYQKNVLTNLGIYEAATRQVIENLEKDQSNADLYQRFSQSMKKWSGTFYGRPIVSCVAPYLNFQDLHRQEEVAMERFQKTNDQKDFKAMMGARQAQLNLANHALTKIKSLQNAAK